MRALGLSVLLLGLSLLGLSLLGLSAIARAEDVSHRALELKVMVQSVPVRVGPGGSFREIGRVGKGQIFRALDRSADGGWYRIRLARGRSGWVLAEFVWPFEVVEEDAVAPVWLTAEGFRESLVRLSVAGGVLDANGLVAVKLGLQPGRTFGFEAWILGSVGLLGTTALTGADVIVTIAPWRPIAPFVAVGAGVAFGLPNRGAALFHRSVDPLIGAGGGLVIVIGETLAVRAEARQLIAFTGAGLYDLLAVDVGLMVSY